MIKLRTLAALGAGYVFGTRAGREQFEKIKEAATSLGQQPQVQKARASIPGGLGASSSSSTSGSPSSSSPASGGLSSSGASAPSASPLSDSSILGDTPATGSGSPATSTPLTPAGANPTIDRLVVDTDGVVDPVIEPALDLPVVKDSPSTTSSRPKSGGGSPG